jgi:hypothetical protein
MGNSVSSCFCVRTKRQKQQKDKKNIKSSKKSNLKLIADLNDYADDDENATIVFQSNKANDNNNKKRLTNDNSFVMLHQLQNDNQLNKLTETTVDKLKNNNQIEPLHSQPQQKNHLNDISIATNSYSNSFTEPLLIKNKNDNDQPNNITITSEDECDTSTSNSISSKQKTTESMATSYPVKLSKAIEIKHQTSTQVSADDDTKKTFNDNNNSIKNDSTKKPNFESLHFNNNIINKLKRQEEEEVKSESSSSQSSNNKYEIENNIRMLLNHFGQKIDNNEL